MRCELAAAKMLYVVKIRDLLLRSRPSATVRLCGCFQMVGPLRARLPDFSIYVYLIPLNTQVLLQEGTRWFGKCWYYHDQLKYEFDVEFDIPVTYPATSPEIALPELDGKTAKVRSML